MRTPEEIETLAQKIDEAIDDGDTPPDETYIAVYDALMWVLGDGDHPLPDLR